MNFPLKSNKNITISLMCKRSLVLMTHIYCAMCVLRATEFKVRLHKASKDIPLQVTLRRGGDQIKCVLCCITFNWLATYINCKSGLVPWQYHFRFQVFKTLRVYVQMKHWCYMNVYSCINTPQSSRQINISPALISRGFKFTWIWCRPNTTNNYQQ